MSRFLEVKRDDQFGKNSKKNIDLKLTLKILSLNLFILSGSFFLCICTAFLYSENCYPFILAELITLSLGIGFFFFSNNASKDGEIKKKSAYFIVTTSWVMLSLLGTLPYLFSGSIPSFTDALFESVSGFSTTGASILIDIEALPKSILFWRSLTHWIGGIGIIMLTVIILPSLKIGGYHLFTSESSLNEKIKPKIRQVGVQVLFIYIGLTLIEMLLLILGDMSLFESICHAFGTIATGGFSPKNTSIAGYSPYIQYVVMVFMLLSGANFILYYYLLRGKFKKIRENEEFKFYLFLIILVGTAITLVLYFSQGKTLETSFRESFFQVISIITTTGFASADYLTWPTFAWMLIFFSLFVGGCTGSTSGGIKIARHVLIYKSFVKLLRRLLHPKALIPIRISNKVLTKKASVSALSFLFLYLLTFAIGTIIMAAFGVDGETASSAVATCMAGIGPGIGTVGPVSNFAHIPEYGKIVLSVLMIIGRLEIYTVVILASRSFWKY